MTLAKLSPHQRQGIIGVMAALLAIVAGAAEIRYDFLGAPGDHTAIQSLQDRVQKLEHGQSQLESGRAVDSVKVNQIADDVKYLRNRLDQYIFKEF